MNRERSGLSALTARSNSEIKREKSPSSHGVSVVVSLAARGSDAVVFRYAVADARRRELLW